MFLKVNCYDFHRSYFNANIGEQLKILHFLRAYLGSYNQGAFRIAHIHSISLSLSRICQENVF